MNEAQSELYSRLRSTLESFGLGSMTPWLIDRIVEDSDELTIMLELRKTKEYANRFPAMQALTEKAIRGGAVAINEGDYLRMERGYRQAFASSGLPPQMFDSPDDFKRLIENDIDPVLVQKRIAAAKEAVNATDPNVRAQLQSMYGITSMDLMAYALDPDRNEEYIRKIATTAIISGYGQTAGLGGLDRGGWEGYSQDLINQQATDLEIRTAISEASLLAQNQSRLAEIEDEQFTTNDALDISIRKDAKKAMASQQRVDREKARWSGTTGMSGGAFGKQGI